MDDKQAKELGQYLRSHREAAAVSIRSLAAEIGIDQAQIIRLEQGTVAFPRADVLGRYAERVGLPVADVLTMAGYPTSRQLPNLRPYMRAKYRDLPPGAVDEVEAFIAELQQRHGHPGPSAGEDEAE
jgi:transcriptional regulator with XRE-family HTH domain